MKTVGKPAWSCGLHVHGDAEVTEALQEPLGKLFFVALLEVMRAEVMVFDAITEYDVRRVSIELATARMAFFAPRRLLMRRNYARR